MMSCAALILILIILFMLFTPNTQENFINMDDINMYKNSKITYNKSIRNLRKYTSSQYNNLVGSINRGLRKGFLN